MAVVQWDRVPQLTPALKALGGAFNARFPRRDGASDGAWGDAAHKLSPSGHNPDDTAGSRPESEDADNVPEVRAIDVDADLRESGVTMQMVCDAIVASPADRGRLSYIIFNRRIIGSFNRWAYWDDYQGDNPHDKHAHFSGLASQDAAGSAFRSVTEFGRDDDMELSDKIGGDTGLDSRTVQQHMQDDQNIRNYLVGERHPAALRSAPEGSPVRQLEKIAGLVTALSALQSDVREIKAALQRLAGGAQ